MQIDISSVSSIDISLDCIAVLVAADVIQTAVTLLFSSPLQIMLDTPNSSTFYCEKQSCESAGNNLKNKLFAIVFVELILIPALGKTRRYTVFAKGRFQLFSLHHISDLINT